MWNSNTPYGIMEMGFKDDFQLIVPIQDKNSVAREIRFCMSYF